MDAHAVHSRLGLCRGCPHRTRPCNGSCPCKADPAGRTVHAIAKAGNCPLGLFGNVVTEDRAEAGRGTLATIAHGAAGLAKAALGLDRADEGTIAKRREVCGTCEHNVGLLLRHCDRCGCQLRAKTTLKGESCPDGRW